MLSLYWLKISMILERFFYLLLHFCYSIILPNSVAVLTEHSTAKKKIITPSWMKAELKQYLREQLFKHILKLLR